jgi:hypothetical protein
VRTLVLSSADVGGEVTRGMRTTVSSRVLLSGVMLLTSEDPTQDLTGLEVVFRFTVTQRRPNVDPVELLTGSITLAGGPDGTVELPVATGALAGVFLPLVEFPDLLEELPLVEAVPFTGIELPFEYDIVVGEEFDLELSVEAEAHAVPGGTGAAATFGLPQEGLASVIERVKQPDLGQRLVSMISERVDTTGEAYANGGASQPWPFLFPACGLMGFEVVGLMCVGSSCLVLSRARRRRRR